MIDLSRICERPAYYHHLIDCLADWGQDTLVLHFCDDQGFGIRLPGFETAAHPWALDAAAVGDLLAHARRRGVRLIPEIEPFGHTLWVTRIPGYGHCYLGEPNPTVLHFSAVDPRHDDTLALMDRLVAATCALFDDPVVHVGCDEVDLGAYCRDHDLDDPAAVWADFVNRIFAMVRERGRIPMFWADHAEHDAGIRQRLDKDAIAIAWHYDPDVDDTGLKDLTAAGFGQRIAAPAASCWRTRCHSHRDNCDNMRLLARHALRHGAGYLTTVWCPMRHVQGAMDFGMCFGALMADSGGTLDGEALDAALAERLFGSDDLRARRFCRELPLMMVNNVMGETLMHGHQQDISEETWALATNTVAVGEAILPAMMEWSPPDNRQRWSACLLAARTAVHCARGVLDADWPQDPALVVERHQLIAELEAAWDHSRWPQDPAKHHPTWGGHESGYLLHLLAATAPDKDSA